MILGECNAIFCCEIRGSERWSNYGATNGFNSWFEAEALDLAPACVSFCSAEFSIDRQSRRRAKSLRTVQSMSYSKIVERAAPAIVSVQRTLRPKAARGEDLDPHEEGKEVFRFGRDRGCVWVGGDV